MRLARHVLVSGAVAVAACGLIGSAAGASGQAAASAPPGEVTLPALYGDQLPKVNFFASSSAGFAWLLDERDQDPLETAYYASFSSHTRVAAGVGDLDELRLSGDELVGDAANHEPAAVNIDTGVQQIAHCSPTYFDTSGGEGCLSLSSDGETEVLTHWADGSAGSTTSFTLPSLPAGYTFDPEADVVSVDAAGAVLRVWAGTTTDSSSAGQLVYLDFTSGDVTLLDGGDTAESDRVSVDADWVVWTTADRQVYWASRSAMGAAPSTFTSDAPIVSIAVSGSNLAYVTTTAPDPDPDISGIDTFHTGTLGTAPAGFVEAADSGGSGVYTGESGNFVVIAGSTVSDYGVYDLDAGAKSIGAVEVLFGPTAPLSIEASAGRIISVLPDGDDSPAEQRRVASNRSDSRVVAARPSALVRHLADSVPPATSGGETAYLTRPNDATCELVVLDGTTVIGRYPVPVTSFHVTLSGDLALVTYDQQTDITPANTPGATLININTGTATAEPVTEALSGDLLAYIADGDIIIKNLSSGAVQRIDPSTVPELESYSPFPGASLAIAGQWIMVAPRTGADFRLVALDLATGAAIDVPADVMDSGQDVALADGVLAWIDASTREVHLDALTDGGVTDEVIGTAHDYDSVHDYLALTDDFVAWVANDDTTKVLPLSGAAHAAPNYLGGMQPDRFSPARHGSVGDFTPRWEATRPLTSWTLTITRHGRVDRVLHGTAPIGAIQPRWNGRTTTGRRAPDGTYRWTLTGSGTTGRLHPKPGTKGPITGHLHLHWKPKQ